MNHALIIVDIQNDYFSSGKMELFSMETAAKNAQRALEIFRDANKPVFHIQHLSIRPGSTFFLPETFGAQIHQCVAPQKGEPVIQKHFPNSFRGTSLQDLLVEKKIEEITFCGAMSHMCIDTSVRAAFDLGFRCRVVSDACATRNMEFDGVTIEASQVHATFMASLSGTFAQVVKVSMLENQLA